MKALLLTPDQAIKAWHLMGPQLARLVDEREHGRFAITDVADFVARGDWQMWGVADGPKLRAVFFTEIVQFPRGRWCRVFGMVGEGMAEWLDRIADVEAWAREQGCVMTEVFGRRGWGRALKGHGYDETDVVLKKELSA